MINYLLLPASLESLELYRSLLLILAGGYGSSDIQPVWILETNKDKDLVYNQIKQLTEDYMEARCEVRAILKETRLFSSELHLPLKWYLPIDVESSALFRMDDCEKVIRALKQEQHFPTEEELSKDTIRFVYLYHLEETDQIGTDIYSALVVLNTPSSIPIQTVARVCPKAVDEKTSKLLPHSAKCLSYFQENGNLLVAGLNSGKEALLAPDYVKLKAAMALAHALCTDTGCSAVVENRGIRTGAIYTSDLFPSEQASTSLKVMGCILEIYKKSANGELVDWNHAFRTPTNNTFWPSWTEFQKIEPFLKKAMDVVKNPTYRFDDPELVATISKALTRQKKIDAHSSQQERAAAQFLSLYNELKAYYSLDSSRGPDLNGSPLPNFTIIVNETLQNIEGLSSRYLLDIAVSPCPLIEACLMAFTPERLGCISARSLRSLCLDIWEDIYNQEILEKQDIFTIKELDLGRELNDVQHSLLSVSLEGAKLLSAELMYMLYMADRCVAITHPGIGFVPLLNASHSDNKIRELGERDHGFIVFMGIYTEMFSKQMSPLFVQYVRTQSQMLRSSIESDGYNIIAKYPTLRHHVGLDVISI